MAEFHLVGEIVGGVGFKHKNIFCKVTSSGGAKAQQCSPWTVFPGGCWQLHWLVEVGNVHH